MKAKYTLIVNKQTGERGARVNLTGAIISESENPSLYKEVRRKALANLQRQSRDSIMREMGLTKVFGAVSGKVYWE